MPSHCIGEWSWWASTFIIRRAFKNHIMTPFSKFKTLKLNKPQELTNSVWPLLMQKSKYFCRETIHCLSGTSGFYFQVLVVSLFSTINIIIKWLARTATYYTLRDSQLTFSIIINHFASFQWRMSIVNAHCAILWLSLWRPYCSK